MNKEKKKPLNKKEQNKTLKFTKLWKIKIEFSLSEKNKKTLNEWTE